MEDFYNNALEMDQKFVELFEKIDCLSDKSMSCEVDVGLTKMETIWEGGDYETIYVSLNQALIGSANFAYIRNENHEVRAGKTNCYAISKILVNMHDEIKKFSDNTYNVLSTESRGAGGFTGHAYYDLSTKINPLYQEAKQIINSNSNSIHSILYKYNSICSKIMATLYQKNYAAYDIAKKGVEEYSDVVNKLKNGKKFKKKSDAEDLQLIINAAKNIISSIEALLKKIDDEKRLYFNVGTYSNFPSYVDVSEFNIEFMEAARENVENLYNSFYDPVSNVCASELCLEDLLRVSNIVVKDYTEPIYEQCQVCGQLVSGLVDKMDVIIKTWKQTFTDVESNVESIKTNSTQHFTNDKKPSNINSNSIDDLANQVINGDWGNGQARKIALEEAGYNYREIQDRVNAILLGTGAVVTNSVTNSAVSNITNNNSSDSNPGGNVQYRVDDTSNTVLDDKNKEYLDALRKAEADGEAKLKKLKEEYANKYKQLTDEQTKKIEQLKKEQEDALRKLKEEQQKKLQEMKQQLKDKEAEMAKIKAEQAAALEKLKKEQAEALKKQLEEQAKELDALKDKHAQEIGKIKQETADAIAKIKNEQKSTNTITNGSSNNGNIPLGNKPSSNGSNSGTTVADSSNTNSSSTNNDSIVISDNNSNSVSDKPERPSYTTITTNPVTKTNSKSSNAGVVGTILGIGALGAAGAVGARYIKKKKENEIYDDNENYFSNDEEFSQSTEKDTNESTPRYEAGSVNGLVLDDDSDINITNTKSISNDTLDFE